MKALKLAAIVLGIFVVLIVGAIVLLLAMFDSARIKSELVDAVQEKTQRTLKIDGDLGLFFWPNVGIEVGKTALSEFKSPQEFAAIDGARVSIAVLPLLTKRVVVEAIELDGASVTLIKRKDGTLNIDDLMAKDAGKAAKLAPADGPATPLQVDIAAVKVSNAKLVWRDEQRGEATTLSGFDLATGRIVGDTATQAWSVEALNLAVAGKRGAEAVALTLAIPKLALDGDAARTLTLDSIAGSVELASPRMPMKSLALPLDGQLHAELAKETAKGTLSTRFDESNIQLKFGVAKFSPLDLGFDLAIDRLNVDKYLPPEKSAAAKDDTPTGGVAGVAGAAREEKIDLSALKALNAHGDIRVGQLQAKNLKMADIKAKIDLAGGKLDVAPHSMKLYGGSLAGTLSVNANGNAIALRENLTGVSINPLLKDLADQDLIEGHGDVRLDVTTRGATVPALKQALDGTAAVALKDGALKGINLAQSFRELKAMFSRKEDTLQKARATDQTDFSELTATFRIADGVARNDDFAAKTPFLRLGGAGDIDIGKSRLDYVLKATVVETSGGQGGKDLEHLRGVTVPVRASGPFDQLAYRIEFGRISAEGALKAKLDEKKKEVREDLKKKAREELMKGLFGK
ncbi:MAG: AsmA family protein [Rhodocyclales bacterium]|nr:AsmA family protein [Rhodocyclales bacterium]